MPEIWKCNKRCSTLYMLDFSFGILEVSAHVMSKFVKFLLMRNVICCHSVSCCHLVMYPHNSWRVFILRMRAKIGFTFHARTLSWNFVQKNLNYVTVCTIIMNVWKVYLITLKYTMMIYDYDSCYFLYHLKQHLWSLALLFLWTDGCYVVCELTALFGPLIDSRVRMCESNWYCSVPFLLFLLPFVLTFLNCVSFYA
jgi:hypothetical protein